MSGALKYDREISPTGETSVAKLLRWIKEGSSILEMGPATGAMTRLLKAEKNSRVVCIEVDPDAAARAAAYCDRMIVGDLNRTNWKTELGQERFDYIIFADVLEHLVSPAAVLRESTAFLKPGGEVLISIPNVGYQGVIAELLEGRFDYRNDGLMDETHLRFFTRHSVEGLLRDSGLKAAEWDRTSVAPEFSEFRLVRSHLGTVQRQLLDAVPDGNVYQFLVRAVEGEASTALPPDSALIETKSPEKIHAQLFFDDGSGIKEAFSHVRALEPGDDSQLLSFATEARIRRLRLDPIDIVRPVILQSISIRTREGRALLEWSETSGRNLESLCEIKNGKILSAEGRTFFYPTSPDPQLLFDCESETGVTMEVRLSLGLLEATRELVSRLVSERAAIREQLAAERSEREALAGDILRLRKGFDDLLREKAAVAASLSESRRMISDMMTSASWRMTGPIRTASARLRNVRHDLIRQKRTIRDFLLRTAGRSKPVFDLMSRAGLTAGLSSYEAWRIRFVPTPGELSRQTRASRKFRHRPLFSIIFPVYKTHLPWLREAIESVRHQSYERWELCIADDGSDDPGIRSILSTYANEDSRIKYFSRAENGHIVRASNSCLGLADGDYVVLLDHDDYLAPHALYRLAEAINRTPEADILYSDEDKVLSNGSHVEPTFKPGWSPEYFLSFMYTGHISAFRRRLVEEVGGFREGFEGSQDYDLMLRASERTGNIVHVPDILYHWRSHEGSVAGNLESKPYAFPVARKAIGEALCRRGFRGCEVRESRLRGLYEVTHERVSAPEISRIAYKSRDERAEIDCTASTEREAVLQVWRRRGDLRHRVAVITACAHMPDPDGLRLLADKLLSSEIGCAGPLVLSTSSVVQSAGLGIIGGDVVSFFEGADPCDVGYRGRLVIPFNVSAISPQCIVFKTELLRAVSRPYETFAGLAAAICMEGRKQGLRTVLVPSVSVMSDQTDGAIAAVPRGKDLRTLRSVYRLGRYVDPYVPAGFYQIGFDPFPAV